MSLKDMLGLVGATVPSQLQNNSITQQQLVDLYNQMTQQKAVAKPVAPAKPALPRRKQSETFVCWRWWRIRVVPERQEAVLRSTFRNHDWDGPIMHAHANPADDEAAGIYGYFFWAAPMHGFDQVESAHSKALRAAYGASYGFHHPEMETIWYPVGGEVELFGTCVKHDQGVRGQHARIRRLQVYPRHMPFMRPEVLKWIEARYGCDVEIGEVFDETKLRTEEAK